MNLPYFDAHCDTLSRCLRTGESLLRNSGQCDLERLSRFENPGQVFAIYHDSKTLPAAELFRQCEKQAALFAQARAAWPERMGKAVLSIEGSELMDCDGEKLDTVYGWGVRCINLTWNHANRISGSHRDEPERGLSQVGRDFARRAYARGILPDVSHLSDPGFWDLAQIAEELEKPLFASHSNSRTVWNHTRNLTDGQFMAIRDSGGVVGINLFTAFVGERGTMDELLAHFEHFLDLDGQQALGLGSDWDGDIVGPDGIDGVEKMDRLAEAFAQRNYSDTLIRAIFHDNLARLLEENEIGNV